LSSDFFLYPRFLRSLPTFFGLSRYYDCSSETSFDYETPLCEPYIVIGYIEPSIIIDEKSSIIYALKTGGTGGDSTSAILLASDIL
tara:strand:- start:68 stop:325 length:258 start_codon:yes stop_codon:yes gene_type:complete